MALCLYVSMGGIPDPDITSQEGCLHISKSNNVSAVIQELRIKFKSDVDEARLSGWQGLQTWLNSHQHVECCIVIDVDIATLNADAINCIRTTQAHVSWIATLCLAKLVRQRKNGWLQEWTWHFPTMAQLEAVDDADRALNRQSTSLDVTDCQVIKQVQNNPLKTWLDKVWAECGDLQQTLIGLADAPTDLELEKERILDELGLYIVDRGNRSPLALLLMSYVRVNHCQGGWLFEARCGPIRSMGSWLQRLAKDIGRFAKRISFWIVSVLAFLVGTYMVVSGLKSLTSDVPLQLLELVQLLSGVMLIVAGLVLVTKKLQGTLDNRATRRVIFISLLLIILPTLQEFFSFLLDRPIEIPLLIGFLVIFALVAFLLFGVFSDEI